MTLPNIFTKKYHRSIIISIEVSSNHHKALYKNTKLQSTKYRKLQIRLLKTVPKNHPTKWALDAHSTGNECPSLVLSMPITWSLSARVTGTQRPANVLIPNYNCQSSNLFLVNIDILNKLERQTLSVLKTEIVDITNSIEQKQQTLSILQNRNSRHFLVFAPVFLDINPQKRLFCKRLT